MKDRRLVHFDEQAYNAAVERRKQVINKFNDLVTQARKLFDLPEKDIQ